MDKKFTFFVLDCNRNQQAYTENFFDQLGCVHMNMMICSIRIQEDDSLNQDTDLNVNNKKLLDNVLLFACLFIIEYYIA